MKTTVKLLLFIFMGALQPCAYSAVAIESNLHKEIVEDDHCLNLIQELARTTCHSKFDWENDNNNRERLFQATNCGNSAMHIIWRLTDNDSMVNHIADISLAKKLFARTNECLESKDKLMHKDGDRFTHSYAHKLFTQAIEPEHLLFCLSLDTCGHVFIIEKKGAGITTWYRIYQSWYRGFTLAEWLAMDRWQNRWGAFGHLYENYGKGKKLNRSELEQFFKDLHKIRLAINKAKKGNPLENIHYMKIFDLQKELIAGMPTTSMPILDDVDYLKQKNHRSGYWPDKTAIGTFLVTSLLLFSIAYAAS